MEGELSGNQKQTISLSKVDKIVEECQSNDAESDLQSVCEALFKNKL